MESAPQRETDLEGIGGGNVMVKKAPSHGAKEIPSVAPTKR